MANPVNQAEMLEYERRDFMTAKRVIEDAFSYTTIKFSQEPPHSVHDAVLEAEGKQYIVEIKSRRQSLDYGTFPILLRKHQALLAEADRRKCGCLYIVLNNGEWAYIYDLRRVRLTDCTVRPWKIRKWQLSENAAMEEQMTVFIPFKFSTVYQITPAREHI